MGADVHGVFDRLTQGVRVVESPPAGFLRDAFHGELVRTEHAFELLPRAGKIAHVEGWISDDAQIGDGINSHLRGGKHVRGLLDAFLVFGYAYLAIRNKSDGEIVREPNDILAGRNSR